MENIELDNRQLLSRNRSDAVLWEMVYTDWLFQQNALTTRKILEFSPGTTTSLKTQILFIQILT